MVKIDENGNKIWDRRFGGSDDDEAGAIIASPIDGYVVVGNSDSGAGGDKTEGSRGFADYWLVKMDTTQNVNRLDNTQPVAGSAANRWSFMTAWNLTTGQFQVSPKWQNGVFTYEHDAVHYHKSGLWFNASVKPRPALSLKHQNAPLQVLCFAGVYPMLQARFHAINVFA